MTDWVHLQGRPARFLLNAGPVALLVGTMVYLATRDHSRVVEPGGSADPSLTLPGPCAVLVCIALVVLGPAFPLVKVDSAGFTVLGLPWRRMAWDDVTGIRRYSGAFLKYVVVSRRSGGEVWLTQPRLLKFRNADLDEELNALTWRWDDWTRRNAETDGTPGTSQ